MNLLPHYVQSHAAVSSHAKQSAGPHTVHANVLESPIPPVPSQPPAVAECPSPAEPLLMPL
eukprot:3832331-Karenia_brevis.AAC.1